MDGQKNYQQPGVQQQAHLEHLIGRSGPWIHYGMVAQSKAQPVLPRAKTSHGTSPQDRCQANPKMLTQAHWYRTEAPASAGTAGIPDDNSCGNDTVDGEVAASRELAGTEVAQTRINRRLVHGLRRTARGSSERKDVIVKDHVSGNINTT
ncbi:hypothetical protein Salat_2139600 [Sesamum alatum]|uniref:Uncharacterized protein n=1 Tax=Sesamum alatum TaxID=300844 RepID=A0AAE1Y1D2_9LAMI|nr:hypothetical protein Salat_2139600 [Sesamum alatum]